MPSKGHRQGGKFGGSHTTIIPAAEIVADTAAQQDDVTNISLGVIKAGLPSVNGQRRVKITDAFPGLVVLSIRDNTAHQELRVFTRNPQATRLAIARAARNSGLHIAFGKR